ncbi:MAG TPA: flagellar basal body-associated FliL family protein [Pirellulaceae bacterium]|jgi:flagellar FliL protein|nr:flagellar basal body-associated FliL family protein [Pirellulaceae bacterium]
MSAPAAETPVATKSRSPIGGLLIAGLFIVAVIGAECAMAYLLIPSADDIRLEAQEKIAQASSKAKDHSLVHELAAVTPGAAITEVDLDAFTINMANPATNSTVRVDFHLYATMGEEQVHEFQEIFARRKHRIRDLVITEIRQSKATDLRDPELGLIKRRILEKTNEALGHPLLRSIVFSDFRFMER